MNGWKIRREKNAYAHEVAKKGSKHNNKKDEPLLLQKQGTSTVGHLCVYDLIREKCHALFAIFDSGWKINSWIWVRANWICKIPLALFCFLNSIKNYEKRKDKFTWVKESWLWQIIYYYLPHLKEWKRSMDSQKNANPFGSCESETMRGRFFCVQIIFILTQTPDQAEKLDTKSASFSALHPSIGNQTHGLEEAKVLGAGQYQRLTHAPSTPPRQQPAATLLRKSAWKLTDNRKLTD